MAMDQRGIKMTTENLSWSEYDFTQIPFDDIVSFGQRTMLYRNVFNVSWILSRFCNYACSYCWAHGRSSTRDHRPLEVYLKTIDSIKEQSRANGFNSFHFSLSGGEPTINPSFMDIVKYLADDVQNCPYASLHMTSNCSQGMKWFSKFVEQVKPFHRASVTASLHTEYVKTEKKMQIFADKLILCQENDIQITINQVMRPNYFEDDWNNALFFHEKGINTTLKPQSDEHANFIVDGYTDEMLEKLYNGMPQRAYTEVKRKWNGRPKHNLQMPDYNIGSSNVRVPATMQIELTDSKGKKWFLDQAERFNAWNWNRFKEFYCHAGFQNCIIREPCGSVKRGYSCIDQPLGNIETGFKLFDAPVKCITETCVSSADSKLPKWKHQVGSNPNPIS